MKVYTRANEKIFLRRSIFFFCVCVFFDSFENSRSEHNSIITNFKAEISINRLRNTFYRYICRGKYKLIGIIKKYLVIVSLYTHLARRRTVNLSHFSRDVVSGMYFPTDTISL